MSEQSTSTLEAGDARGAEAYAAGSTRLRAQAHDTSEDDSVTSASEGERTERLGNFDEAYFREARTHDNR